MIVIIMYLQHILHITYFILCLLSSFYLIFFYLLLSFYGDSWGRNRAA